MPVYMNSHVMCTFRRGHLDGDCVDRAFVPPLPPHASHHRAWNPLESPFDKEQEILQGQDSDRKPGKLKVLFWLNSPIVFGLGTADCLGERVECDIERRNDVL